MDDAFRYNIPMKSISSIRNRLLNATYDHVYRYGYHGASTAAILHDADAPKGSMYHHFSSKKGMVLAMIRERLTPKMEMFFDFTRPKGGSALAVLQRTLDAMADNTPLITYGCPLHRLMLEMGALDPEILAATQQEYDRLSITLSDLLRHGMEAGEIRKGDPLKLAQHIILSVWGFLSRPPADSSAQRFRYDCQHLIQGLCP